MRGECNPLSPDAVRGACNPQLNANLRGVQGFVRVPARLVSVARRVYMTLRRAKIAKLREKPNNRARAEAAGPLSRKRSIKEDKMDPKRNEALGNGAEPAQPPARYPWLKTYPKNVDWNAPLKGVPLQ